jgi:hypothetical protein
MNIICDFFMAVPHYTYLVLKMLGPRGITTVKGSFKLSDLCDKEFHKMAQTFGIIAEYGQLKGKKKRQGDHSGHEATRRKQRRQHRARSEETTSPRGEPGRIYNERIRVSHHLGEEILSRQIGSRVSKIRLFSHEL